MENKDEPEHHNFLLETQHNNIDSADQTERNEKKSAELGAPYKRIKHNITVDITKVKKSDDTHLR